MKKIIFAIVAIVILGVIYTLILKKETTLVRVATSPTYGFEFTYPASLFLHQWNASTTPPQELYDVAFLTIGTTTSVTDGNFFAVSYAKTLEDAFAYFVVPESVPRELPKYIEYFKTHMKDFPFPEGSLWTEETVNGTHYYKISLANKQSYITEHNGFYVLTFSTENIKYITFEKHIAGILSSFRFTK